MIMFLTLIISIILTFLMFSALVIHIKETTEKTAIICDVLSLLGLWILMIGQALTTANIIYRVFDTDYSTLIYYVLVGLITAGAIAVVVANIVNYKRKKKGNKQSGKGN